VWWCVFSECALKSRLNQASLRIYVGAHLPSYSRVTILLHREEWSIRCYSQCRTVQRYDTVLQRCYVITDKNMPQTSPLYTWFAHSSTVVRIGIHNRLASAGRDVYFRTSNDEIVSIVALEISYWRANIRDAEISCRIDRYSRSRPMPDIYRFVFIQSDSGFDDVRLTCVAFRSCVSFVYSIRDRSKLRRATLRRSLYLHDVAVDSSKAKVLWQVSSAEHGDVKYLVVWRVYDSEADFWLQVDRAVQRRGHRL